MSNRVVEAVLNSRIEPRLRHLATVLAYRAHHDDGSGIFVSLETLMRETGQDKSTLCEGLQDLADSGLVLPDGYHRHTRKRRIDMKRLESYTPAAATRTARRARRQPAATAARSRNGRKVSERSAYAGTSHISQVPALAGTSDSQPSAYADLSTRVRGYQPSAYAGTEVLEVREEVQRTEERTAAAPLRSWTAEKAREPNGNNQKVIEKLAYLELKTSLEHGQELTDSDLVELVKQRCADHRIDYGRHPDVSHRVVREACERARYWETRARAAGRLPPQTAGKPL